MSFGRYQFLSWSRRGIARHIAEKDTLGKSEGTVDERATLPVQVKLSTGDQEDQNFTLLGPGDVTGINSNMIIRTAPLNNVSNYEPNLLPYVEFFDEDFPYRYTPAAPHVSGKHLRPWLALLVLKENEFIETKRREPLASIQVPNPAVFPPVDELHLWAHMHSNLPHEESDFEQFLDSLEEDVKTDPDGVYSRLLCPRKLEPHTFYHAFLVPAYETGRLGGLGRPTVGVKAQAPSWPAADSEYPIYHRWSFRTGKNFDFEYMVKLLKPRVMDKRVGVREMDCSRPAFIRADDNSEVRAPNPNVMLLEGALLAPDAERTVFPEPAVAQPFFDDIEKLVNLNRLQLEDPDQDPFVSVPFYGMYHAMRRNASRPGQRDVPVFQRTSNRWYNELNRDPRQRVPAGFGKQVVQKNQEEFSNIAWRQLNDVLEANRRMQRLRFSMEVTNRLYNNTLVKMEDSQYLAMTHAMSARVRHAGKTARTAVADSVLTKATIDPGFMRMTRPTTSIVRGLRKRTRPRAQRFGFDALFTKTNKAKGISAEVKENFNTVPKLKNLKQFVAPASASAIKVWSTVSNLDKNYSYNQPGFDGGLPGVGTWNTVFKPTVFLPTSPIGPGRAPGGVLSPRVTVGRNAGIGRTSPAGTLAGRSPTTRAGGRVAAGRTVGGALAGSGTGGVGGIATGDLFRDIELINTTIANNNFSTAVHNRQVKTAYTQFNQRLAFKISETTPPVLQVSNVALAIDQVIQPTFAYERLGDAIVKWPGGMFKPAPERFLMAMAYPDIPNPAYQYLIDIDKEFLLPNLHLIENNSLSLLRTNQKFIESYMVGLNYEMGRELMWREYPTDMRGSYFRQFWDVKGFVTPDSTPADAEKMKDIKPIHLWPQANELGRNNAREEGGDSEQLVFVVRGDLLKKYPNTVIYAQKAIPNPEHDDSTQTKIRVDDMTPAQFAKEVRFPLYQAEIKPDIKLLGFDLTVEQASGRERTPGFSASDKRGWYFVIAEVPGEPQFGMDISFNPNVPGSFDWNDLSWENLPADTTFVRKTKKPALNVVATEPAKWGDSSAHMASILLQRPVMVAVHATEMLDRPVERALDIQTVLTLAQHIHLVSS